MTNKKTKQNADKLGNVEQALSRSEQFIENNQKFLIYTIIAIVVIVLGYFGYNNYVYKPKSVEAAAAMFQAERYFEQDSMNLALYGDGNNFGFLYIVDEYGNTPSGKLAKYYAGIAFLQISDYDNAIKYLGSFSSKDNIFNGMAKCAIGDAYMQKGDTEMGVQYYMKAAKNYPEDSFNTPIYLMKAGLAYEELGQYTKAAEVYKAIKTDYAQSREGRDIEKYISRAEFLSK